MLTARLLKATPNHQTVPFVALSSSADEVARAHASRLFDIVLETPFSIARVRAAIFTAFVRKRSFFVLRKGHAAFGSDRRRSKRKLTCYPVLCMPAAMPLMLRNSAWRSAGFCSSSAFR
jgi:hypothetical protein